MAPDVDDPFAKQLFEAARREKPRAAARTRALRAVAEQRGARSFSWLRLATAASLAGCVGLAFVALRHDETPPTISAERPTVGGERAGNIGNRGPRASLSPTPSEALASAASPSATADPPTAPVAAPVARPSAAKPRLATQQEELTLLDRARELLTAGDAAAALSALDRYEGTPSERRLGAEALLLRIQTLAKSGRAAEASTLADRFVARFPNSPLADRARSFVSRAPDDPGANASGTEP